MVICRCGFELQQPHGAADLFFAADDMNVIAFPEDVGGGRIRDDLGFPADRQNPARRNT